ncbi:MAG: hypothetical protein PHO89_00245 [Methylacidiphilaceae bacterium]|nr:hypothetical protein [Candidatus Methylacidiphilaceae bacterium]
MKLLPLLLLLVGSLLGFSLLPSWGQDGAGGWRKRAAAPPTQFDVDFRPGRSAASASFERPSEKPEEEAVAKAYHILGMPLNAFLQAMAQRAGTNYIPTPDVQGMVNSVFYDLDPLSMAKAGARANGYMLESLDGVFVVHRFPPAAETQPLPSTFTRKKSMATLPASSHPVPSRSIIPSAPASQEAPSSPRISKKRPPNMARDDVRPPKKLPVGRKPALLPEDKKLIALTKKLAQQKEEQKELLDQERQLHRRLREEERALEAQRKATEKALREQLVRAKKAAEEMQRLPTVE